MKKNIFLIIFASVSLLETKAQSGSFRVTNQSQVQIGYDSYKYLTFGSSASTPNNGNWSIESSQGLLNFWKPYPSTNWGNYKLCISDAGKVGINQIPVATASQILQINGSAIATAWNTVSDVNAKKEITILDSTYGLKQLSKLRPVKYKYRDNFLDFEGPTSDSNDVKNATLKNKNSFTDEQTHVGFIAQDVEKIFPTLVSNYGKYKVMDYIGLIPILIKSVQEQQLSIENQDKKIQQLTDEIITLKGNKIDGNDPKTKLFINNPNPFKESTVFTYLIEETQAFTTAEIDIRDFMGMPKKTLKLDAKNGLGKIEFYNKELTQGYYVYSLKIDGQLRDCKMFLIE